jgi:monoamine oxidase
MPRLPYDTFNAPQPDECQGEPHPAEGLLPTQAELAALSEDCRARLANAHVAIVGGGFAGLAAAWHLRCHGVDVGVFEASAQLGGRVRSDYSFAAGKVVEAGAELIGANHRMWRELAGTFGLTLVELGDDDPNLRARTWLDGRELTPDDEAAVGREVAPVLQMIGAEARDVDPMRPWTSPYAAAFDATSINDRLLQLFAQPQAPPPTGLGFRYLTLLLGLNNLIPTTMQSYLGLLALVSGGRMGDDMLGYWNCTEHYRCAGGNVQLAHQLAAGAGVWLNLPVTSIAIDESGVVIGTASGQARYDYVVLAAPPTVWSSIAVSSTTEAWDPSLYAVSHGPAIKFLSTYPDRFWASGGLAADALWDGLGQVWEGTDGQDAQPGPFCLTVFSGGQYVPPDGAECAKRLDVLFPGGSPIQQAFVDWRVMPWCGPGYAMPTVGQVTTVAARLSGAFAGRLVFAGEQTCMGWVGYMEGALRSGGRAARTLVDAICGAEPDDGPVSESWGGSA